MTEEHRVREIVLQVIFEALRARDLSGVVLVAPPTPERDLLERWLRGSVRVVRVDTEASHLLGATDLDRLTAWLATGHAAARREGLLMLHPAHKSRVLLDGATASCLPLGDLWGSQLVSWTGGVTMPRALAGFPPGVLETVERALRRGLEEGEGLERTLAELDPDVGRCVREGLRRGRSAIRPPLVPKLSSWTPGVDPPP